MTKEEIKTAVNDMTAMQIVEFNETSEENIIFNASPGGGTSKSVGDVVAAMKNLSNASYFDLEDNPGTARIGGVRSSRPC